MDRRRKILLWSFAGLILLGVFAEFVYPTWIEPLLTIDRTIAQKKEELEKLQDLENRATTAKRVYRTLVSRVGSFDVNKVENDLRNRLNALIEKHELLSANVSPSRSTPDRKTGIAQLTITVSATGTLASAVGLLKDVAELPHVLRIGNATISPEPNPQHNRELEHVNLRVPIEVMVLPQNKMLGKIDLAELSQPEQVVRHAGTDFGIIASKEPFTEPIPVTVDAGKDLTVEKDKKLTLFAKVSGGDGKYVYHWQPADKVSNPTLANPDLDTSTLYTETLHVTVTDGHGRTATDDVVVTVKEVPRKGGQTVVADTGPKAPPPPADTRWKERGQLQLCMALQHTMGDKRVGELMVVDTRTRQNKYYAIGDEFNGANLVFVHPTGGLAKRKDDYEIYPIGLTLDREMNVKAPEALEYPDLVRAAEEHRKAGAAGPEAQGAAGSQSLQGPAGNMVALPAPEEGPPAPEANGVEKPAPLPVPSGPSAAAPPAAEPAPAEATDAGKKPGEKAPTELQKQLMQRNRALRGARGMREGGAVKPPQALGKGTPAPAPSEPPQPTEEQPEPENEP